MTELAPEESSITEAAILDVGAHRLFKKSWADVLSDFARIGRTPSADFTAAVLMAGTLALHKEAPAA